MKIHRIISKTFAEGPGCRFCIWVQGCPHRCKGCFATDTWDEASGTEYTYTRINEMLEKILPETDGITLLGGEPFEPENQRALLPFVKRVKETYPNKNIWAFTGFTLEQLKEKAPHPRCEATDELLSLIDILVDGRFEKDKKNLMLKFRGSSNQRIIDLPKSLAANEIILWDKIDKR